MEQRAHLYTLTGVCALPRAYLRTGNFPRATIWRLCRNKGLHPLRRFAAIPAHPQKQYTRLWRLYHFCGFYYPIREVIPIAIYHWNIGIVSRGKGKSAVAAAAYRSGEKLTNEWDGMTHDYTRKGGVVHTEIMLPPHAPPSFSDRSTLWNSVELYEKAGNAQLAREIDAALPIELSREEQIRLVREYCSSQFVSRGMCVDFAIHDTDSGTPHCHIMLTMRPLDERGAWAAKSKKDMTLMKTVSVSACQAADIRRTRLTSRAGTAKRMRLFGARHGLIFQTTILSVPEARSVSTTAVTPSAALTKYRPSIWA